MSLPSYNSSVITSVARTPQSFDFPQYILGGQGGASHATNALFKRTTLYVFSDWRSPVYQIGQNFDVTKIKFAVTGGITGNKSIIPVLYFDNATSSSPGTIINTTNYPNSDKLISLTSNNFSNTVHGTNNFFLELQFTGSALAVVKLPIEITIDVEDV